MKPWILLGLYVALALIVFERGLHTLALEKSLLLKQAEHLTVQKREALKQKGELVQVINSQNDPEWIEMTLMKVLGLVPEGCQKIVFKDP